MYCPQCGTESVASLQYCRVCGANLKVIGKAVTLSEAIARSDRGPLPKLKEMMRNLKLDHVTEEISGALDKMSDELVRSSEESRQQAGHRPWWHLREKKTPERRREDHRVQGTIAVFAGLGVTIFLYNLAGALVLKLPPDIVAKIPFELDPLVHVLWTLGFIPMLSGVGHLAASFFIKSSPPQQSLRSAPPLDKVALPSVAPVTGAVGRSVTEGTTELLGSEEETTFRR